MIIKILNSISEGFEKMEELYGCCLFLRRVFNCTVFLFLSIRIQMLGFTLTFLYVCITSIAFT